MKQIQRLLTLLIITSVVLGGIPFVAATSVSQSNYTQPNGDAIVAAESVQTTSNHWTPQTDGDADATVINQTALDFRVYKCSYANATRDLDQQSGSLTVSFSYNITQDEFWEVAFVEIDEDGQQIARYTDFPQERSSTITGQFEETVSVDGDVSVTIGITPSSFCSNSDHEDTYFHARNVVTSTAQSTAETLTVDADGGADYQSISNAVSNASDGDTVEVQPGTYTEQVRITNNITLTAPQGATIDGSGSDGIQFTDPPTTPTIRGFTITGFSDGIDAENTTGDWTIADVTITDTGDAGIDVARSSGDWEITGTTISQTGRVGIEAQETTGSWRIESTTVEDTDSIGILTAAATGSWRIEDTIVRDAGRAGIQAEETTGSWHIVNMTVENNAQRGIDAGGSEGDWTITDTVVASNTGIGIQFKESSGDFTITDSVVEKQTDGFEPGLGMWGRNATGDWTVSDTTLRDNSDDGIGVPDASGQWTLRNIISVNNSGYGVRADETTSSWTIEDSRIEDNTEFGIWAGDTTGNWIIEDTAVTQNDNDGIDADETTGDWLLSNVTVTENTGQGISARRSEGAWTISDSDINNNSADGILIALSMGDGTIRATSVTGSGDDGVDASESVGDWQIEDSEITNNVDSGVIAATTQGAWGIENSSIVNNGEGVNATLADIEGDATGNWWGQASGPTDSQCIGNVDCSSALSALPGESSDGSNPQDGTEGVTVTFSSQTVSASPDGSTTVDLQATNVNNGIRSYSYTVRVSNTSVATVSDVELVGASQGGLGVNVTLTDNNGTAIVSVAQGDDTNGMFSTLTMRTHNAGTAGLQITKVTLGDDDFSSYNITATTNATIEVSETTAPPAVVGNNQPTDPDGDGKFDDITGDGTTNILDVGALLQNRNSPTIQNNADKFDFTGDGRVNILDVGKLLQQVL